jgi:hypothetical protein
MEIWKSKKGNTDIAIFSFIVLVFVATSIFIPLIQAEVTTGTPQTTTNEDGETLLYDAQSRNSLTMVGVVINIFQLGFWDVDNDLGLPFWLDAMFSILLILAVVIMVNWIIPG